MEDSIKNSGKSSIWEYDKLGKPLYTGDIVMWFSKKDDRLIPHLGIISEIKDSYINLYAIVSREYKGDYKVLNKIGMTDNLVIIDKTINLDFARSNYGCFKISSMKLTGIYWPHLIYP